MLRAGCALLVMLQVLGCAPMVKRPGEPQAPPHLAAAHFVAADGAVLPVRRWLPDPKRTRAVIIALHGFNDYSRAFVQPCSYFRRHDIACYAYDQRGFGEAPNRGFWAGTPAYTGDLAQFAAAVRQRHPGRPVYLLGESMGAAVAIVALTEPSPPRVDGVILSAPAVWARSTMPWYQQTLLAVMANTAPGLTLTGEGLKVVASDNLEVLKGLGRDPWVIKATRVDAIYGLANLMDAAMARVEHLQTPALVLLGDRDEIIPRDPIKQMLERLPQPPARVATYAAGYHLLLRDLQAEKPWSDIVAWVDNRSTPLPSGSERHMAQLAGWFDPAPR